MFFLFQFDYNLLECLLDEDVWCQWQRENIISFDDNDDDDDDKGKHFIQIVSENILAVLQTYKLTDVTDTEAQHFKCEKKMKIEN